MSFARPLPMLLLTTLVLTSPIISASDTWQDAPRHPVILTVTGELGCCPSGQALFDLERLQALPQVEVRTQTPWTDQQDNYRGPRLSVLIDSLQGRGEWLEATALNDYATRFNLMAARQYPVILATHKNGQPMSVRDKGPIWILYPLSDSPELRKEEHQQSMVWQLKTLHLGR
ncbi:hypothetical protein LJY18_15875 [Pseudomonas sp. MMS21-TM103]|uniref:hypothetical protein n=1 Tax=Pseudomonas sp. MMS21 TM103 TaxID=2886506 RepID=UPI001EDE8B43|nr:hypothetical protein [Pseudomonas sp. MMS21 TM103]MCG4454773.1 hypothetical protein [Pseudomonas sp. MMS21 TM103]